MNHSSLEDIAEAIYNADNYVPYAFQYTLFKDMWPTDQLIYTLKAKEYVNRKAND